MRCQSSQDHPDRSCFCSACHLSSELFPRRQDGKIVLPGLPAVGDSPPLHAAPQGSGPLHHLPTPLTPDQSVRLPSSQSIPPIPSERANNPEGRRPRARSNARIAGSGSGPSSRLRSVTVGTDGGTVPEMPSSNSGGSSMSKIRPRSRSQSYLTTTTAVSNPYPIPNDPHTKTALDNNRSKAPTSPSGSSSMLTAPSTLTTQNSLPTPPLKFCPPFVACDRIVISPDSDAAKEGITMIPWSVRRRKQKYRSGFDSGTGQGKGKTMFRYYGPENDSNMTTTPGNNSSKKR